ncbi:MAG: VacJ family lipoprotein [Alphaproteobacteria bacterium]|nr:VacJ family lipoprotein [Alphaproteobacteria bacterium]
MFNKFRLYACLSALSLMTAACSSTNSTNDTSALETYNRAVYNFNTEFQKYILKPVTKGYRKITTPYARERISNALMNIKEPIFAINHILQGEPVQSGKDIARFAVNSTLGIAGTYDVAGLGWNLPREKTGFDATLATWGVADGPFIMLPFVGPSTPRATAGLVGDSLVNPVYWATNNDANIQAKIYYPYMVINAISQYEAGMDMLDDLERNSVDFYETMKSAYMQNRHGKADSDSISYDFGMDDEDEDY